MPKYRKNKDGDVIMATSLSLLDISPSMGKDSRLRHCTALAKVFIYEHGGKVRWEELRDHLISAGYETKYVSDVFGRSEYYGHQLINLTMVEELYDYYFKSQENQNAKTG